MWAIYKRELKTYFNSAIGYIYLAVMFVLGGYEFYIVFSNGSSEITYVFSFICNVAMYTIPLLTMRLMSEDKKLKTDQLLLTAPVSISGVIFGKFLAALTLYFIAMLQFIAYILVLSRFATPDWNVFLGNFLGLFLLGAALIAIGLFISSLTENQVIAAIGCLAITILLSLFDTLASVMPNDFLANIFTELSVTSRYDDFVSGILDVSHILFFVSVCAVFIFLSIRALEKKRWS
jgi:ABC-2 type transport system permease protein